jgi:GH18 family chitinase
MIKKYFIYSLLLVTIFASCKKDVIRVPDDYGAVEVKKPTGEYKPDTKFKSVAYCYHTNAIATFDTAKLAYITHLHLAFLNPQEGGTLQTLTNFPNFEKLKNLAKEKGVKTAISLSGSELIYRTIAANEKTRKILIKNIVDFAVRYGLDGIDLDWEYPRANHGSDVTFGLFMQELSAELHSWHKYLSMAVTAGLFAGPVKDGITPEAMAAVDFVNLMAYDGIGTDTESPNHHSSYKMAEKVLNIWITEKGLPKEKAILGIPLYGKNAANTARTYVTLLADGANANDDQFTVAGSTYYYNGINTIKAKTLLAKDKGNGVMFWEYGQDARGANSLIKAAYDVSR